MIPDGFICNSGNDTQWFNLKIHKQLIRLNYFVRNDALRLIIICFQQYNFFKKGIRMLAQEQYF